MPETNDVISHLYYDLNDKIDNLDQRLDAIDVEAATEPKVYVALLTQTGTDAPVATVLKNTLGGAVVWTYDDVGQYNGTLANAFTLNKTVILQNMPFQGYADEMLIKVIPVGDDIIRINVLNDGFNSVNGFDFLSIRIEVYP